MARRFGGEPELGKMGGILETAPEGVRYRAGFRGRMRQHEIPDGGVLHRPADGEVEQGLFAGSIQIHGSRTYPRTLGDTADPSRRISLSYKDFGSRIGDLVDPVVRSYSRHF